MNTIDKVLDLLTNCANSFMSGEQIASELNISRNAVWKCITSLKEQGVQIDAVRNKGYCIVQNQDILSEQLLQKYSKHDYEYKLFDSVTSTNDVATSSPNTHKLVIVAKEQTKGKGRQNRHFYSPNQSGVYFSLKIIPSAQFDTTALTAMAGVAVCNAISELCALDAKIKWVNDIFVNDKKVCGILTQAQYSMENNAFDYIVIGIGINVYAPKNGFDSSIQNTATALFASTQNNMRAKIIAKVLDNFIDMYNKNDSASVHLQYKKHSNVIGEQIVVISPNCEQDALAIDIDTEFRLVVKYQNGQIQALNSNEIRIRRLL